MFPQGSLSSSFKASQLPSPEEETTPFGNDLVFFAKMQLRRIYYTLKISVSNEFFGPATVQHSPTPPENRELVHMSVSLASRLANGVRGDFTTQDVSKNTSVSGRTFSKQQREVAIVQTEESPT